MLVLIDEKRASFSHFRERKSLSFPLSREHAFAENARYVQAPRSRALAGPWSSHFLQKIGGPSRFSYGIQDEVCISAELSKRFFK